MGAHYHEDLISSFRTLARLLLCVNRPRLNPVFQVFDVNDHAAPPLVCFHQLNVPAKTVRRMLCYLYVVRERKCVERQRFADTLKNVRCVYGKMRERQREREKKKKKK